MRKLILQEWLSVDGMAADKGDSPSFLEAFTDRKYSDLEQLAWLDTIDTILLGANTYRMFAEFWPTATNDMEIIADKLNSIPKIVFSSTLTSAPWGNWPQAKLISTGAAAAIKQLKQQPGKDIVMWGSISLAQSLMRGGLIDEYHFSICPLVLGEGRPMFRARVPLNLELIEAKMQHFGILQVKYRPAK